MFVEPDWTIVPPAQGGRARRVWRHVDDPDQECGSADDSIQNTGIDQNGTHGTTVTTSLSANAGTFDFNIPTARIGPS